MKPAFIVAAGRVTGDMRLPPAREQAEARARMMMSRSALLASLALHTAVDQAGWSPEIRAAAACFFGVGPSTGDLAALERLLAASASPEGFAIDRLGQRGLRAVSPLFTFQLMHNFTLCHGSILEGIGGPNGAFFSRGAATGHALAEALWALHEGDATHALAGGADAADYPVTAAELRRAGVPGRPAEGAAVLALATAPEGARARVDAVRAWSVDPPALDRWLKVDAVVTHGLPGGEDARARFGETLAAAPLLACTLALEKITAGAAHATVLAADAEAGGCAIGLSSPGAPPHPATAR